MNLGVLLPLGESLTNYAKYGQDVRFVKYYLTSYCHHFNKVFVFSYEDENYKRLPKNCNLITPGNRLHRYLSSLVLPFVSKVEYRQCDVFRCFHPSAAIPAIVGKIFFGKKFIFNYNYDYLEWARIEGKSYLIPLLFVQQYLAFICCDGVFVADEKMEQYAKKIVDIKKITLIRNGVDTEAFKPRPRLNKHTEKIILSVGRFETQKNYIQLIHAVSKVSGKVKLVLVGRGSLRENLIVTARKCNVKLEIIDSVSNNKLPGIYNQADVYVQPSLIEAPVKTLLEAMSCGRPCVATNVPGIRDLIVDGRNGLLAELDSNDIAGKIQNVLSDDNKAKKMGLKARELVKNKYDLIRMLEKEITVLKNI